MTLAGTAHAPPPTRQPTTTTTDDEDRRKPLIVFHGTDVNSANNIINNGLNVRSAMNLGGGDVFWTSTNPADARIFAEVNPTGGTPAVLQVTIPRVSADAMIRNGTLVIGGSVHQFLRPSWTQLNNTAVFTRVQ